MTGKPVIPTRLAKQNVEDEVTHCLVDEGSDQAALGFIAEIEQAYERLAKHLNIGSALCLRVGHTGPAVVAAGSLPTPDFYIERETHVEVWRVLNGKRDIPAWLLGNGSASH